MKGQLQFRINAKMTTSHRVVGDFGSLEKAKGEQPIVEELFPDYLKISDRVYRHGQKLIKVQEHFVLLGLKLEHRWRTSELRGAVAVLIVTDDKNRPYNIYGRDPRPQLLWRRLRHEITEAMGEDPVAELLWEDLAAAALNCSQRHWAS